MTRVLVVWEDAEWKVLGALMKRIVQVTAPPATVQYPAVLGHTVEGNGRFAHYVESTWPRVRSGGLVLDKGPIDHLVCVIDGDRAHELVAAISKPPKDAATVGAWHLQAEAAWTTWLRQRCAAAGPPSTTVHGVVLRWAKESVLLAGYDQPALAAHLEIEPDHPDVVAALRDDCTPDPRTVADAAFVDTFRQPLRCTDLLGKARKLPPIDKNAPEIDDAIRDLTRQSLSIVRARVPDLARLATLTWTLHAPSPTP